MPSHRGLRHETGRPWHYHGTQGAHCFAIQAGWYFHYRCCPRTQRGFGCVWLPPLQRQLAEMLHRRHSIVTFRSAGMKIGEWRQQGVHCRPLVWTADGRPHPVVTRFRTQQTSLPVGTGSICRRNHLIAGGSMRSKSLSCGGEQPWPARSCRIPQRAAWIFAGIIDRTLHQLSTAALVTTTSTTLRLTQQYQTTTMTLFPWRATCMNLCSHEVSNCPGCLRARGSVVGQRWLSHAMSRARSVSGQVRLFDFSTSRTVLRTTRSQGNKCLTCGRWRMTSFSGVSQRSRLPQRFRGATGSSALTSCATSPPQLICNLTKRSSLSDSRH